MTYRKLCLVVVLVLLFVVRGFSQTVGLKTNLLYGLTTTPNLGLETRVFGRSTIGFNAGFNPFKFPAPENTDLSTNPKMFHWIFVPEYKYWFCRPYERWFVGVYGDFGSYNLGGVRFMGIKDLEEHRYEGSVCGGGFSAGYQWAFARRWGLEASLGMGYMLFDYDKYLAGACGALQEKVTRHYFGPTKASISIIYYIY